MVRIRRTDNAIDIVASKNDIRKINAHLIKKYGANTPLHTVLKKMDSEELPKDIEFEVE